ncbi:hypothetical protein PYCC9005_005153 [Savitreella phatthalungensis]
MADNSTHKILKKGALDLSLFCKEQIEFIESERALEAQETQLAASAFSRKELERRGHAVLNLEVGGTRTGFGGKTLVELVPRSSTRDGRSSFSDAMRTGDLVRLQPQLAGSANKIELAAASKDGVDGVVTRVSDDKITLTLDREDDDVPQAATLWLVKLANSVTYDRMLDKLRKMQEHPEKASSLTRILLGQSSPSDPDASNTKLDYFDLTLNATQKAAVVHVLASPELALIHGPPGTGKTYTLVEVIRQLHLQKKRVLVCGPSNISVDNIVERLAPTGVPIVRTGHPARLLPSVVDHAIDVLSRTSDAGEIVRDIRKELDQNLAKLGRAKGKARREIYGEVKALRKEFRVRERRAVDEILRGSAVVLTTLHGAGANLLQGEHFDVVIIDEAAQALEASCWIPLLTATKCILAGDHLQLSPLVRATKPKPTLFERLLTLHGDGIKRLLSVQYRMHERICEFPSRALYGGELVAGEGVAHRLLSDLPRVMETEDTMEPVVLIDTQGDVCPENADDGVPEGKSLQESKSNDGEVSLVVGHVTKLCQAGGVDPEDIAVVTPYSAQVAAIRQALSALERDNDSRIAYTAVEVGTVDGFQGREKQAIVLSLVRSNDKGQVGFLADKRRLNVAMTRPKRHLCVIGDSTTITRGGGKFLKDWMTWLTENADLRYP